MIKFKHLFLLSLTSVLIFACTSKSPNHRGIAGQATKIKPWQVMSTKGELIVSDVFYADDIQNDQAMNLDVVIPTSDGKSKFKYGIDSLIYPTIGNPKLFIKSDDKDAMMTVMRIDHEWLTAHIDKRERIAGNNDFIVDFKSENTPFKFFLSARDKSTRSKVELGQQADAKNEKIYEIFPEQVIVKTQKGVPTELRTNDTVIVYFNSASMNIPKGFYDFSMKMDDHKKSSEIQYNSVKIFEDAPVEGKYSVLNITDSQVSFVASALSQLDFAGLTLDKLKIFIDYVNSVYAKDDSDLTDGERRITNASFMTFNGDLHNGGQPITLGIKEVAETYNDEARRITALLRQLPMPIFLTVGNHDGYASMGHMPGAKQSKYNELYKIVKNSYPKKDYPNRDYVNKKVELLKNSVNRTKARPGGEPRDIFFGKYTRRSGAQNAKKHWKRMSDDKNNYPLQDGFYQWRKTYGPLNSSWTFGDNYYVNLNTFDIRQYRRTGWGMYTVNYGGNVSGFQADWFRQVVNIANETAKDVILNAHHDPRGGHYGKDYPYYFKQIEFKGMAESFKNYVSGEILNPQFCKMVPGWAQTDKKNLDCIHDGLQEWMRPDPYFDCLNQHLVKEGSEYYLKDGKKIFTTPYSKEKDTEKIYKLSSGAKEIGRCNIALFKPSEANEKFHPYYSGFALIHQIAVQEINTMLLGHTHYNNLEIETADVLSIKYNNEYSEAFFKNFKKETLNELKAEMPSWSSALFQSKSELKNKVISFILERKAFTIFGGLGKNELVALIGKTITIEHVENKLLPEVLLLDSKSLAKYAQLDVVNPVRAHSEYLEKSKWYQSGPKLNVEKYRADVDKVLKKNGITKNDKDFFKILFKAAGHTFNKELRSELVVARMTTLADLSTQKLLNGEKSMYGFTVMDIYRDQNHNKKDKGQVNKMHFYVNNNHFFQKFKPVCDYSDNCHIDINRNESTKIKFLEVDGNDDLVDVEFIKRNPLDHLLKN